MDLTAYHSRNLHNNYLSPFGASMPSYKRRTLCFTVCGATVPLSEDDEDESSFSSRVRINAS